MFTAFCKNVPSTLVTKYNPYEGIHRHAAGMGHVLEMSINRVQFYQNNIWIGCNYPKHIYIIIDY